MFIEPIFHQLIDLVFRFVVGVVFGAAVCSQHRNGFDEHRIVFCDDNDDRDCAGLLKLVISSETHDSHHFPLSTSKVRFPALVMACLNP